MIVNYICRTVLWQWLHLLPTVRCTILCHSKTIDLLDLLWDRYKKGQSIYCRIENAFASELANEIELMNTIQVLTPRGICETADPAAAPGQYWRGLKRVQHESSINIFCPSDLEPNCSEYNEWMVDWNDEYEWTILLNELIRRPTERMSDWTCVCLE